MSKFNMRMPVAILLDRLEQAEQSLSVLKDHIDIVTPAGRALHQACWAVRDSYKEAITLRDMTNTAKGDEPMPPMPHDS